MGKKTSKGANARLYDSGRLAQDLSLGEARILSIKALRKGLFHVEVETKSRVMAGDLAPPLTLARVAEAVR